MHKVTILDIEHIQHANRIIIKYYLSEETAVLQSEGWIYIANSCGYKGICDTEWICIEPNTQHPLHSNSIKTEGIYYFVWDYFGVGGLSNEDFTSTHSFVIQIALQDTGCGWIDPCIEFPNLNWEGKPVEGNKGEEGNCGLGWHIELDDRGCSICVVDELDCSVYGYEILSGPNEGDIAMGTIGTQGNCDILQVLEVGPNGCPICVGPTADTEPGGGEPGGPPTQPGGGDPPDGPNWDPSGDMITTIEDPTDGGCGGFICEPGGELDGEGGLVIGDEGGDPPVGGDTFGEPVNRDLVDGPAGTFDFSYQFPHNGVDLTEPPPAIGSHSEGKLGGGNDPPAAGTRTTTNTKEGYPIIGRNSVYAEGALSTDDTPSGATTIGTGPNSLLNSAFSANGPGGTTHASSVNSEGYTKSGVLGEVLSWIGINSTYGDGVYIDRPGKVTRAQFKVKQDVYGGRAPYALGTSIQNHNNKYNKAISTMFSPIYDPPSENELGLTTRHFKKGENFTLNSVANQATFRGSTAIKNAIGTSIGSTYLNSHSNYRNTSSFLSLGSTNFILHRAKLVHPNELTKYRELRPADRSLHARQSATERGAGIGTRGPISSSYQRNMSIGGRTPGLDTSNENRLASKDYAFSKVDTAFTSSNKYGISVVPNKGAIGSIFHASCYAIPKEADRYQTISIEMYIVDSNNKSQLIKRTRRVYSNSPRRLAGKISTKDLAAGSAHVFYVIKDSKGTVIFKQGKKILLTSSGQLAGIPDSAALDSHGTASLGSMAGLFNNSTISEITLPIGSLNTEGVRLILNNTSTGSRAKMGVQTLSKRGQRKHSISLYNSDSGEFIETTLDAGDILYTSDTLLVRNDPNSDGADFTSKTKNLSGSVYKEMLASNLSTQVIASIFNHGNNSNSFATIKVGGDVSIVSSSITLAVNNNDGTYTLVIQTPLAYTNIDLFETGGNNIVSSTASTSTSKTDQFGALTKTITLNRGSWLGVAVSSPTNIPLSSRTFYFEKIN